VKLERVDTGKENGAQGPEGCKRSGGVGIDKGGGAGEAMFGGEGKGQCRAMYVPPNIRRLGIKRQDARLNSL